MTGTDCKPFDFRNAGTTDASVGILKNWLARTSDTFEEQWDAVANAVVELKCHRVLSRTFQQQTGTIVEETIGCRFDLGEQGIGSLAYASCRDLVSVISCILGTGSPDDATGPRELTSIEMSLSGLIFETLASSLSDAWSGDQPLAIATGELDDSPQLSRLMAPSDLVFVSVIGMKTETNEATIFWIVPRREIEPLFRSISGKAAPGTQNSPRAIVELMEVELTGILGRFQMPMQELAQLKQGDLVVLNQRIDEPIALNIDQTAFFRCWPGRIGKRQGVKISETL